MPKIAEYEPVVGSNTIEELRLLAGKLQGKVIQNINSTAVGGGVAEILNRMVPLLQELGVDARWDFIKGGESFFNATKKFHNALHGKSEEITPQTFEIFMETSQRNIDEVKIYGDIMFIHDPQPIALIKKKASMPDSKWIWRCHFFQAEDGIRDDLVTGVQTCALPILFAAGVLHMVMTVLAALDAAAAS